MNDGAFSERALILAPMGRDAAVAADILARAGLSAAPCASVDALLGEIEAGAGLAVIAEEALLGKELSALRRWIAAQPAWSDFSFVILAFRAGTSENPHAQALTEMLGNVSFVERPFHPSSLASLARSAVRARRRQYEARARIEELRFGEERLRIAQLAGGIGTFELLPEEGRLTVSDAFCALWGLPVQDSFAVEDMVPLLLPEDRGLITTDRPRLPPNALDYVEYRIRRPDTGEVRWIARRGQSIIDAGTGRLRHFGVTYDITARKRDEQALVESRDRLATETAALELLNRISTELGVELDPERLVQRVVQAGVELIGATSGAFAPAGAGVSGFDDTRKPASRLAVPVVSRSGAAIGALVFGHPEPGRFDERSERLISGLSAQAAVAIDNATLFDRVQTANTTLEARVAERTRERDRMWRLSSDLMDVCNADGQLLAVNRAWTSLLGWSEEELLATNFLDLVHPDDVQATRDQIGRLEHGATTFRFENRFRTRDGTYRDISWTAAPEGGMFYAVGRDVTEQRAVEDQLRQSQKMEAVGQLTGGIAHDFNNLLQGITGSLDIVQRRIAKGRSDDVDRFIAGAVASANRAAALTHRLLAFSRRQPLDPKPVRANPLVLSMADLLRRTLGEQVTLELKLDAELWLTLCDPNQLENAILNLCINARDAMPRGGTLEITTFNSTGAGTGDAPAGDYIGICVGDTGEGMPPEVIARAFDPFFTTKPIGQGTGLGLSMTYGFVRQSEGHVRISSEVGRGTAVRIYLPRHAGDAEEAAPDRRTTAAAAIAGDGETVLVIEDDAVVRALIVETLSELGYRAIEAGDGEAGVRILESDARLDLLVTDIGLPGLDGRAVADRGRALRPALRILFMTGYAENAALASGFLEPGMELITKPFAMDALALKLRAMVEGQGTDRESQLP